LNIAMPPGVLLYVAVQVFPLVSVAVNMVDEIAIGSDGARAD